MSKIRPRAIFIGVPQVGDALAKVRKEWEFLPSVPDIGSLWEGLTNGTIDNNIQVILILDTFFDPSGEDTSFEKLVVNMSPYCLFGVVNYKPSLHEQIKERVDYESYSTSASESVLYFYIDPQAPNKSLDNAVREFVAKSSATDAIAILTGRDLDAKSHEEELKVGPASSSLGEVEPDNQYLGQIVAVTSSKGGSGKSTVSTTLASYIAHASEAAALKGLESRPLKVLILDLDIRDGQLGFLTGNSKPTVINLRLNGVNDQTITETVIHSNRLKVDLLLAPKRPRNSDDTPPDFYIDLLTQLRRRYDYVFLDTSVNYLDPLLEKVAYPVSDQIIFVTDIVVNSVFSMTRWIQEVTKPRPQGGMGINPSKIGIVVNKALADVNMSSEKIELSALGLPIISVIPSNPKLVAHSANMQSIELLLKHPEIRGSIQRLARAIVGSKHKLSDDF